MALINCSECGKDVSDKASTCPNCGNPLNIPNISLRCPKCNSTQLTSNKKGFSGGKALVGAVATGGVGLLAGTIGSGDIVITCLTCGYKHKAGNYTKEKDKLEKEARIYAKTSNSDGNAIALIIVLLAFSCIGFVITYKLFSNGWNFLGFIFAVATAFCVIMLVFCIYEELKEGPTPPQKNKLNKRQ